MLRLLPLREEVPNLLTGKLKQFQKANAIPTPDLVSILGVSKQLVYYWREYGIRSWTTARRLAKKLNCNPEEIIGTVDE